MSLRTALLAVLALSLTAPAFAQDADGDGAPNASDAFPCDATVSAAAFAPAQNAHGMILVEDQWPAFGDMDTNDLVATYNYAAELDGMGRTHRLRLTFNILAIGGLFDNGAALRLPVARTSVSSVSMSIEGGTPISLASSTTDSTLTVVLQDNLRALFGDTAGQINSRTDLPRMNGAMVVVNVQLSTPTVIAMSDAPFDFFLFRTADPSHEIHQTRYDGTSRMNATLFGTLNDGSAPGRRFVDSQGLPSMILLPESTPYPAEARPISDLFPTIVGFASSGGVTNTDFYSAQVQLSARFVDSIGMSAPAPRAPTVTVDTSCISVDQDGDGYTADVDCNDNDARMYPGNTEVCDGLDNDCNQQIDDSLGGTLRTFYRDADGDGHGNPAISVSACSAPPGYVGGSACTNGSNTNCNPSGSTLISSSAWVDPTPPSGWLQCAGFINTSGNDVAPNFMDNCLGHTGLRVIVTNLSTGQVEEDVYATGASATSWPTWNYLGGSLVTNVGTYWGSTTYFVTNDGRDACGHNVSVSGSPTFGSGNGSRAIIVGYGTNADEYRVNCNGQSLVNRRVAIYAAGAGTVLFDCDDSDATRSPSNVEVCDGRDNTCDSQIDEGNPGGGGSCSTGLGGICQAGTTQCISGALSCTAVNAAPSELCGDGTDNNCNGQVDEAMCVNVACSNGSGTNCNFPGTTLIASSAWVDPNPPSGWSQCAGFLNTNGDDVTGRFLDNCLNSTRLRVRVTNVATGQVEEDVQATNLTPSSSWPSWNYLGGSLTTNVGTNWGTTTFFVTNDGRDACGQSISVSGQPTFGSGNGTRAIIVGHGTNANEYRMNCNGVSFANRRIAIFR